MMNNAKQLNETRDSRLERSNNLEEEKRLRDEAERKRSSKYGGRGDFVHTATRNLLSEESPVESLRRGMV